MNADRKYWEHIIIDALPPVRPESGFDNSTAADIDGDGNVELLIGGEGALLWYRPETGEKGVIGHGRFHVGMAVADIDGDGKLELISGVSDGEGKMGDWKLCYYKPGENLSGEWARFNIDTECLGGAHDILAVDIDDDGRLEVIANDCAGDKSGVFIYKAPQGPSGSWQKHAVIFGYFEEGLDTADLDGDGRLEIVSGPCVYYPPKDGCYAGPWRREIFAPSHREMNRVRIIDISGSGRGDIVIVDSEYFEGQLSWFENRIGQVAAGENPWKEHKIMRGLKYAHSLEVRYEGDEIVIFVAEMAGGGWAAPYNYDAKVMELRSSDNGMTWKTVMLDESQGTHGAIMFDIDNDGELEVFGKEHRIPRTQIWKKPKTPSPICDYTHRFVDRDRQGIATDIFAADIDGNGLEDIVCGKYWYKAPDWQRFELPVNQCLKAYDIDGDGRLEIIATMPNTDAPQGTYGAITANLVWIKSDDPLSGKWSIHKIGCGTGDWPHGSAIAPLLPGGKAALLTSYHSSHSSPDGEEHYPEIWEIPDDPTQPWQKKVLAEIRYGEQLVPHDITGNGLLDIFAGPWWLENMGDGTFAPHKIVDDEEFYPARLAVVDIAGNGRADVVMGQEKMDYPKRHIPFSTLAWFECPADPRTEPWPMHVIDRVRCAHSIGAADLDGDGELEIICGEHDPFYPFRNRNRLFVYKAVKPMADIWKRFQLDDRFEHHDGTQIINLGDGRKGIISIAWQEARYVNLWEPGKP